MVRNGNQSTTNDPGNINSPSKKNHVTFHKSGQNQVNPNHWLPEGSIADDDGYQWPKDIWVWNFQVGRSKVLASRKIYLRSQKAHWRSQWLCVKKVPAYRHKNALIQWIYAKLFRPQRKGSQINRNSKRQHT